MTIFHAQVGHVGSIAFSGSLNPNTGSARSPWSTHGGTTRLSSTATYTLPSAQTEIWVHFYNADGTVPAASTLSDNAFVLLRDNAGGRDVLRFKCTDGTLTLEAWNGSAWVQLGTQSTPFPPGQGSVVAYPIDLHIKMGNSDGELEFYMNERLMAAFYGDTVLNASTTFDQVIITCPQTNTAIYIFGEILICNEVTIGARLTQPNISADGADTQWTNAYTTVDDLGSPADTDFLTTSTNGHLRSFVVNDMPAIYDPNAPYYFASLFTHIRARTTAGAPTKVAPYLRSDGVNYYGSDLTLTASFVTYSHQWEFDPDTGYAWDESAYNALQLGIRSAA